MNVITPLFITISVLAILTPGPDILYTMARGISSGRKAATIAAAGFASGLSIHTSLAMFGLSALLKTSAVAFTCIKILGAAYLVYLGIRAWGSKGLIRMPTAEAQPSLRRVFCQAFLMNVLNPKVSLFYLAFIPQFIRFNQGSVSLQFLSLGICFAVLTFILFSLSGICASLLTRYVLSHSRLALVLDRTVGTLFIALGIRLVFSSNH